MNLFCPVSAADVGVTLARIMLADFDPLVTAIAAGKSRTRRTSEPPSVPAIGTAG
jgi:hypothetical protein